MNLLPNHENAVVDIEKFVAYSLNSEHPEGKHKALIFEKVLGITVQDAGWLQSAILENLAFYEATEQEETKFGKKYVVEMKIQNDERTANVRTAWIIEHNGTVPRLITCYIKRK
jgi:hypothetical protein